MKAKPKALALPITVLAVGLAMLCASLIFGDWYRWEPANFVLNLKPGISESPSFNIDKTSDYLIEIEVERNLPFERINCLLGFDGNSSQCRETPSPIEMKWTVLSSEKVVAEGDSQQQRSGAWSTTISRTIGRFRGAKGSNYVVKVESLKDVSALAPTNPHIVVRVHPMEYKSHYALAQLIGWIAFSIVSVGFLWLLIAVTRRSE